MNKYRVVIIIVSFLCMIALGFNTVEYMCHFAPPETWCFVWKDKLCMPFWYAYFFGGILPLTLGCFLAGLIAGYSLRRRKKRGEKENGQEKA